MELFSEFQHGFNNGGKRRSSEAQKIIKLIEPNHERIVTLQVLEEEPVLSMMINLLTTINGYQNTSVTASGNVVTFTFADSDLAEAFRSTWRD